MPDAQTFEKKFFAALRDIFVGAPVEGASGFVNLMRMKSLYYTARVFPQLQKDIDAALAPFPQFREELFDKLYTFFSRYFSESGSIYFRYTPLHQNVYEKVYTDDKDVMLFYKTHMLYYVKTDRLFQNLAVEVEGVKFFFDVATLEHKKANEKRELIYEFKEQREDGTLVFAVGYSEKGRKTKVDDILRGLKNAGLKTSEETLERAFRLFARQSEVDYFINKNARAFLEEQFDLWMYQYVFSGASVWSAERIAQLQALKSIARQIIAFIAQFEDELVKIWNKPKFVLNSNYVITLDKIENAAMERHSLKRAAIEPETRKAGLAKNRRRFSTDAAAAPALLDQIFAHKNFPAQLAEWKELGIVSGDFKTRDIFENTLEGVRVKPQYRYLPLDTKHFKNLELDILALFENLDDALDGWLIKSENYQALNTILPKFRGKVQTIYIDPPYNTDASEIIYVNDYKDASWLSLVASRIELSKRLLARDGILCVTIDDFEFPRLRSLLGQMFGEEYILGTIVIRNNPAGRSTAKGFSISHEYAIFAANSLEATIGRIERTPEQIARYDERDMGGFFEWVNFRKHGGANAMRTARPKLFYPIYVTENTLRIPKMRWAGNSQEWKTLESPRKEEEVLLPISPEGGERTWKWGHETAFEKIADLKVRRDQHDELGVYMKSRLKGDGRLPPTWWEKSIYSASDYGTNLLKNLFGEGQKFSFPKSVHATADSIRVASSSNTTLVLDFFGGSGTTAHAVINLNRQDGGKRKYILVEMGEHFDTVILPRVKKVVFCENWKDGKAAGGKGVSYFIKYYQLEQYEDTLRRARYAEDKDLFNDPYQDPYHQYVFLRDLKMLDALEIDAVQNQVKVDLAKLYSGIDVAETLSNLTGKWVRRVTASSIEFADGETVDLQNLDWKIVKPLVWW